MSSASVNGSNGNVVNHAIDDARGMKRRENHTNGRRFELAIVTGGGREVVTKEESVVTASGTLG